MPFVVVLFYNISNVICFAGWGNLVFFDTEEHQIKCKLVAKIPKLESQWRIIHDFKPTEYPPARSSTILCVFKGDGMTPGNSFVRLEFPLPNIGLAHGILNNQTQPDRAVKSTQLPKVGEWTRIEFGHEKVDEKYFLFLSVGGREVGRKEVTDPGLRKLNDVKVIIGSNKWERCQPGFIRRLVVLEKR